MANMYNCGDLRKGLRVQIDGDPFQIVECNFVKPGKGQALYKLKLRNLLKGTVIDRTYKSGESIEAADVEETEGQYLYRQGAKYVFMDTTTYDQIELDDEALGDDAKWLKDSMNCKLVLYNGNPISVTVPAHVELAVEYCEPAVRGNTATGLTKPVTLEGGAVINAPAFIEMGDVLKIDTRTGEYLERAKV